MKADASVDLGPLHTSVIFAVTSIWRRAFPFNYFCMLQKLQTPIYNSGFGTQSFYYLYDFLLPAINWTRKKTLRSFIKVLGAFLKGRSVHLREDEFVNIYRYKSTNCNKDRDDIKICNGMIKLVVAWLDIFTAFCLVSNEFLHKDYACIRNLNAWKKITSFYLILDEAMYFINLRESYLYNRLWQLMIEYYFRNFPFSSDTALNYFELRYF